MSDEIPVVGERWQSIIEGEVVEITDYVVAFRVGEYSKYWVPRYGDLVKWQKVEP